MRPLTVRIEGLRSYLSEQTIDFRDKQLMAIVGDTGAGKSSILEALCFALYGSSSWSGSRVKELISHGRDVMKVELVFVADRREWTLVRTASRDNYPRPITKLECPELEIKLSRRRDVDAKVQELVGLDYDAFLRAVILPQGRFQQLLQTTPSDRAKILKGIFRLDLLEQARAWTETWLNERQPQLATLRVARARLAGDPAATAEDARVCAERLASQADELARARAQHAEADTEARRAAQAAETLERARRAASAAVIDEVVSDLARLREDQARLLDKRARLAEELEELERAHAALGAQLAAREQSGLGIAGLSAAEAGLTHALEAHADMSSARDALTELGQQLDESRARQQSAEHRHQAAKQARDLAEEALERARRQDAAAHVATHVAPGDLCPVCAQEVPAGFQPPAGAHSPRAQAEAEKRAADETLERARRADTEAAATLERVERDTRTLESKHDDAQAKIQAICDQLPETIRPAQRDNTSLEQAAQHARAQIRALQDDEHRRQALDRDLRTARDSEHALEREHTTCVTIPARDTRNRLIQHADAVSELSRLVGAGPVADVPADPDVDELRSYADRLRGAQEHVLERAQALHGAAVAERDSHTDRARKALEQVACESLSALDARIGEVRAEHKRERERERSARDQIEPAADLDQRIVKAGSLLEAVDETRKLLGDGKFVSYAVERKQRAMLAVASQLFSDMTDGRFGFAADFQIVDKRAGEARSTETLSGGETFLASLALALALVELANRAGGRLDALFLDEGFGALDADALEQAVQALSAQAARGRLVVVISHLQAVAENIEHVLVVESSPMGSRAHELDPGERSRFDLGATGLVA